MFISRDDEEIYGVYEDWHLWCLLVAMMREMRMLLVNIWIEEELIMVWLYGGLSDRLVQEMKHYCRKIRQVLSVQN